MSYPKFPAPVESWERSTAREMYDDWLDEDPPFVVDHVELRPSEALKAARPLEYMEGLLNFTSKIIREQTEDADYEKLSAEFHKIRESYDTLEKRMGAADGGPVSQPGERQ